MTGGLAMVNVLASMLFAGISGSAAADAAALGAILIPSMKEQGYSSGYSAAITAMSSAIGPIIPPSMIMIVYASISGASVGRLFLGGIIPGLILGFSLLIASYFHAKRNRIASNLKWSLKELIESFREAIWALFIPIIVVGGIIGGVFTATEAGMVSVVYALFCGFIVYREMTPAALWRTLKSSAQITAQIMLILGMAATFGFIMAVEGVAVAMGAWLTNLSSSGVVILILISGVYLLMGTFLDMLAVMIVTVPIFYPILLGMGLNPIHFGVVISLGVVAGSLTPPVGIQLYLSSAIARCSLGEMLRHMAPLFLIFVMMMAIAILVPETITFIPGILMP